MPLGSSLADFEAIKDREFSPVENRKEALLRMGEEIGKRAEDYADRCECKETRPAPRKLTIGM
jgi:hypothetical protein